MICIVGFDGTCKKSGGPGNDIEDAGSLNDLAAEGWEINSILDWKLWAEGKGYTMSQPSGFMLLRRRAPGAPG